MSLNLSEVTPITAYMELTHLWPEASIWFGDFNNNYLQD